MASGTTVTIDRIPEEDRELLEYFVRSGVMPGETAVVTDAAPYRGVVSMRTGAADAVVSYEVAQRIWVTPVGVPKAGQAGPVYPPLASLASEDVGDQVPALLLGK